MAALLETRGLRAFYGQTQALYGIDLAVEQGGVTAVLGANGAGKTTLLRALCAMTRREGELFFDGEAFNPREAEDAARKGIAHAPDGRGTFLDLTVDENLRLGAYTRKDRAGVAADLRRAFDYFPRLQERRHQQAGTLSGGEQQMLAIARALMGRPRMLLLDEPSLGLAPMLVKQIFNAIAELNRDQRITVFLVEQNAFHALKLAHRGYVMVNGRITMHGTGQELLARPEVRAAYLEGGH